jgi:hypothetical protein
MRIRVPAAAEVDAWLAVLTRHGHLHRAEPGPAGSWIVQRTAHERPWTLHHPVLALDYITTVLRDAHAHPRDRGTRR